MPQSKYWEMCLLNYWTTTPKQTFDILGRFMHENGGKIVADKTNSICFTIWSREQVGPSFSHPHFMYLQVVSYLSTSSGTVSSTIFECVSCVVVTGIFNISHKSHSSYLLRYPGILHQINLSRQQCCITAFVRSDSEHVTRQNGEKVVTRKWRSETGMLHCLHCAP